MDYVLRTKTVATLLSNLKRNKYNLGHPLQRKEGQWNDEQKALLIASLLQGYPINPIYMIKEKGTETFEVKGRFAILDGLQRITTIAHFKNDKFAIQRKMKDIDIDGDRVEIRNKKFSDLPKELQKKITETEIQVYEILDYTEENLKEMFYRQNNGTPLSKCQKSTALINYKTLQKMERLTQEKFWSHTKLTEAAKKKDEDREIIIKAMALIKDGDDVGSFNKKYLYDDFMARMQEDEHFGVLCNDMKNVLNDLMLQSGPALKKIGKTSLPMVIYGAYKCKDIVGYKYAEYGKWLEKFVEEYDDNEAYKELCQSGSSQKAKVLGRKKYFDDAIEKLK